jgi:hypothetical protein
MGSNEELKSLKSSCISSITEFSGSVTQSFYRFDVEPHDVYYVEGVLVHN